MAAPDRSLVFLIDSKGLIRTRFEGVADADELRAAIDHLLAAM